MHEDGRYCIVWHGLRITSVEIDAVRGKESAMLDQFLGVKVQHSARCGRFFDQCGILLRGVVHVHDRFAHLLHAAGLPAVIGQEQIFFTSNVCAA